LGRARSGAAIGLIVAVSFAGCGGTSGSSSSDSIKLVASAADITAGQDTARTSFSDEGTSGGKPFTMRSEGTIDFRSGDFEETMTSSEPVLSGEVRVVDGVWYQKSEIRTLAVPGSETEYGKPWTKDSGDRGENLAYKPGAILDQLRAVTDAERLGTEDRRGVSTTRYRLTLNPAKERAMSKSIPTEKLDQMDPTIEVWIDAAGRLRQLRIAGTDHGDKATINSEFYDFGVPVHIQAPPADQVLALDG
jgi:hypothetical protein